MKQGGEASDRKPLSFPSWRRIADFILTVAQLERSYQALKAENQSLKLRVAVLEADVADHTGQLRILTAFLQTAVKDFTTANFTTANMEQAVARQIEKLTGQ